MRRSLTWILVVLLGAACWWLSLDHPGRGSVSAEKGVAKVPGPGSATSLRHAASTNALRSALAMVLTNQFGWRLRNTDKPLSQLMRDPHAILLENAFIETDRKLELGIPDKLRAQGDPGAYVVQARGAISAAFRTALAGAGARIISYIPNDSYLVEGNSGVAGALEGNALVQAVIPYEPYYKVAPSLLGQAEQALPANEQLNLALYPDEAAATIGEIEKLGGIIVSEEESPAGYPVVKVEPPADWTAVAQLSGVHVVEANYRREKANDLARPMMGVAADAVTPTNYLNLTGKNVMVAMADSGVDMTHPDLQGRVFFNNPAEGMDTDGHGTHVAGIIAGSGLESPTVTNAFGSPMPGTNFQFRGKAPAADLFSMAFGDSDEDLQEGAAQTNALISNNSWDYGGDYDYDLAAAGYDAATRDALPRVSGPQPVAFVFSSGDEGNGGVAGTVDSPGTAKDLITVGALEELRYITNQVTNSDGVVSEPWLGETENPSAVPGFSSCGNVGIGTEGTYGRFKPDVVAPGTFVVSCRSGQWDTAAYYNPTNNNYSDFPDFIGTNQVSPFAFQFFVPTNTVEVIFQVVTNLETPLPFPPTNGMPIYASTNGGPFGLIGSNYVALAPGSGTLNQDWSVVVSNTTPSPIAYDLIVDVQTTNNLGNYYQVLSNLNDSLSGAPPYYYRYESGTSMAAAAVSGFLALIEDYFTNQLGALASPALLKAMTINGARATAGYDFEVNNAINYEGWGLPDLSNSIPAGLTDVPLPGTLNSAGPASSTFFREQTNGLATGDRETFKVTLNTNDFSNYLPLRVTLAWTDPPGDPVAALKLVNSLELVVTDLDSPGVVYYGNDIGAGEVYNTPENATNAPIYDTINNVQNIYLQPYFNLTNMVPDADYSVTVLGNRVNVNAVSEATNNDVQDFALVISAGDMGESTDALTVADGGVISNPTGDQNLSIAQTNTILLNQMAGANTPLLGSNTVAFTTNTVAEGTNGQFTMGMTNQWHFYIVTNTTGFTNAAFITFGGMTLSIPRMGVDADSEANATTPGADLDLLVTRTSSDGNAGALTNLDPVEISNCLNGVKGDGASLASGGTDFVVDSNAQNNEVFYIGVKSETSMGVSYGFVPIFTDIPFSSMDQNGNEYINGINVPQAIPGGTASHPGIAYVFSLALYPIEIQNVVVTNVIFHQNFGDLVGALSHSGTSVDLNNHDEYGVGGTFVKIYDDSGQNDIPGATNSDGPGSLKNFEGTSGQGVWQLTEEGNAEGQTGEVISTSIFLQKYQNPRGGITVSIQPGSWFYTYLDVPVGYTNLELYGAQSNAPPVALQMYLNTGTDPSSSNYLFEADLTNPPPAPAPFPTLGGPWNIISDGPPLAPGVYYIGVFNPNIVAETVYLQAQLNGASTVSQPTLFTETNLVPILNDAVTSSTNTTIFISNTNLIASANVGIVVQYPRISDLAFTLLSPQGQRILLMENRGGPTATNAGGVFYITNSIGTTTANGSSQATTNSYNLQNNAGSLSVSYDMYTIPDEMTIYYGNNPATFNASTLLFDSGMISGTSNFTVNFGPGTSTYVTVIMNQFGNTNGVPGQDAWTYTLNGTFPSYNYLTFTEDTNLTGTPIKFAIPPFDLRDLGTNYTFGDLDQGSAGDYFGATNIFDFYGGWTVPSNQVVEVITNTVLTNNANEVSVVTDPAIAAVGSNYLALGQGVIERTNGVIPYRLVTLSYQYRGPGIAGWWRGEGDGRDSSDAEQQGQNGSLIGRFSFPAGEVGQAFDMENNGMEYDFAGTNGYVQIRQQPFLTLVNTNSGTNSSGDPGSFALEQSSPLDVGTGPGLTVEGWINPTNVSFPQPLVEWLARVPTNGSDTNLSIVAGPFLDRATSHYYYLLAPTNWTTSETWATQLGGDLATVDTADEQNWIFDTFGGYHGRNHNLWIGLTNVETGGFATQWAYVSGLTNVTYTNWLTYQPTNFDGLENYTMMFGSTNTYPGLWALADNNGFLYQEPTLTNIVYGVVEVTNLQTNGVQLWISVTNVPGATNVLGSTNGCLFANLVDVTNGSHWIYSGPDLIQSNTWQYVALTYDTNSGMANLYYDGTNVASTNLGVFVPKTTGDVLLGKDLGLETNNYYGGQMDEVSLYNRALSDAEIGAIYGVSAYTSNRLAGKFDPRITPPLNLAEAQVVWGTSTNTILGQNDAWQAGGLTFIPQTNALPLQITGLEPGMLLDDFSIGEAPLGNLYYLPEQSLDDLKDENASGNWTLEIWDTRNNVLATNVNLLSWQLQLILVTNTLAPVTVGSQEPTSITVPPGQTIALAVTVPVWASAALNTLVSSTLPLNVFFNATNQPVGASPPDITLFSGTTGAELLTTNSTPGTNIVPGGTYYIGLQNPGTHAASAVFQVSFNITPLTNDVPFSDTLATNGSLQYYSFDVTSTNAYEATFQLLNMNGNADLVVSKDTPLPTLTSSDYGSFNSGRANENIYVLTNSMPVALSPGTWYLGVFNRDSNAVNYTVLAQEMDQGANVTSNTVNYIELTNGVPWNWTAGPGADLTNFFTFQVTNTWTLTNGTTITNYVPSVRFELYNLSGNADLTVQTNVAPFAPPFYQSSQEPGTVPEFIQIVTNSTLTNLAATYYLGVPNDTTNLVQFTILAIIDTNSYFPAFPGAEGAGGAALGASIRNGFGTNNTVYHVINLDDSGPGSLRDAVSSTNRTVVFDISGDIYLQTPLVVTNPYLTIVGQTAPEGGITVAGAPMIVSTNTHDVVIRYLRFRPVYAGQNLFEGDWGSGNIYEFTPNGTRSTFASGLDNANVIVFDSAGNMYITDFGGEKVYRYTPSKIRTTYATLPDNPNGLVFDKAGNLFVVGYNTGDIYKIPPGGGSYIVFASGATGLYEPWGVTVDRQGTLFAAGIDGHIYYYSASGIRSTFVSGIGNGPYGLTFDRDGNLFAAVGGGPSPILKIAPNGSITAAIGSGYANFGLAFDNPGNLFVGEGGDPRGNSILKITPSGTQTTFASGLNSAAGVVFAMPAIGNNPVGFGDGLQFNMASNVIADHISAMWSSNNDLSILNSSNITVQWSILSDSLYSTNLPAPNGAFVRYGGGSVSLHHNLFADNYTGSPRLGDNIALDFVDNVIYNWVTNAGYSSCTDILNNPNGFTNYLNFRCNYLVAGSNTITTNIAFWGGTNTTWLFQTNNFIDSDNDGRLNGADTKWLMFTNWGAYSNLYTATNEFPLPPVSVDEAYMAYEKVLDFAGVSMFKREPAETNIVENVRRQSGTIINTPGVLPTLSTNLIFQYSTQDGIPDFWKITFGQGVTNAENNVQMDASGYSELEEFDNWLAAPHALTTTNTPVGVDLQKLFGKTGNLSFFVTNAINGSVYLTNVLGSYTNTGMYSNSIAIYTPNNSAVSGTNFYGFGSFDVDVTNTDTVAYFGPVTVSVFVSAVAATYSAQEGCLLSSEVASNNINGNTIEWYTIEVPTNAVAATNSLLFAGAPMTLWYSSNTPPTIVYSNDFTLLTDATNGSAVINPSGAPLPPVLLPGGTYYLGVQNTNNFATNYTVQVTFETVSLPPGVIIINPGQPITNQIPPAVVSLGGPSPDDGPSGGSGSNPTYYGIFVPPNAVSATNTLLFATGGSASVWFNQTNLPLNGYSGDYELIANYDGTAPISSVLYTNGVPPPPLVPNQLYFIAITNTSTTTTLTDAFVFTFGLAYSPPSLGALSNQTVVAGSTLTVDNPGTDTNAGTLYYYLTTVPPVGATISGNGTITWDVPTNTPAETVLFTTVVSNAFTTLTATNSFDVTVLPLTPPGSPQTGTVGPGDVDWLAFNVPTNAIWATNILDYATNLPVNLLFTTNAPPTTNVASILLLNATNGVSVLGTNSASAPTNLVPGEVYYLGIQNTNAVAVNYEVEVDFGYRVPAPPAASVTFKSIIHTTIGGTNGFLLSWFAPTNDTFQVQESGSLNPPVTWNTFSNIITYTGPSTPTNGLFTFFDNGSQYPFGPMRLYRLLSLAQQGKRLTLPGLSNYVLNVSQPLMVTNTADDSNPGALLDYTLMDFPAPATNAVISTNGIIAWTPGSADAGSAFTFSTVVGDNGVPPATASNAFTVFILPAPAISNAMVTSSNLTLQWTAPTNDLFEVEWTTNLSPVVVWTLLPPPVSSTSGLFTFTDTNAPVASRFYRLLWLPPL